MRLTICANELISDEAMSDRTPPAAMQLETATQLTSDARQRQLDSKYCRDLRGAAWFASTVTARQLLVWPMLELSRRSGSVDSRCTAHHRNAASPNLSIRRKAVLACAGRCGFELELQTAARCRERISRRRPLPCRPRPGPSSWPGPRRSGRTSHARPVAARPAHRPVPSTAAPAARCSSSPRVAHLDARRKDLLHQPRDVGRLAVDGNPQELAEAAARGRPGPTPAAPGSAPRSRRVRFQPAAGRSRVRRP